MKENTLSKFCISFFVLLLLFGCATTSGTKEASSPEEIPVITDIAIDDGKVVIKSNKAFSFSVYEGDPYKTTIEIPDMTTGKFTDKIVSDKSGITEIIPRQIDSPNIAARIDIVLQVPSAITPSYSDNTLVLSVKQEQPVVVSEPNDAESGESESKPNAAPVLAVAEKPAIVVRAAEENVQPMAKASEVSGIEIKKAADAVKVLIKGNGTMIPNVFPISERIVVDIPGVSLNAKLPETVIAPLKGIRAGKHKDKLRLVLDLKEKTNFDVTAIENFIEISLLANETQVSQTEKQKAEPTPSMAAEEAVAPMPTTPPVKPVQPVVELEKLAEGEFIGKKISLDFQDADIIPIFRLLGDISGYNMVVSPAVKGNITLKLINVPWDQALDIILKTFSLAKIVDGNIIRIVPNTVVAKEMDEIAKAKKARDEAGELKTKIFPINYADLAKMKDAIDKAKVLSSRGSLTLDERGSSLIVNDLEKNLDEIGDLVKQLDREQMQARQVMISAKIVEVNSNYTKDLGVQWGIFWNNPPSWGDHNFVVTGAETTGTETMSGNPWLVNLPAAVGVGSGGTIGFGYMNKAGTFSLDLALSAMEATNNGKVLSSPKIMTMNNQEAKITQGTTIYVQFSTADKVDYKAIDALLSLSVKPRIAPGGAIFMDLDITKDEPVGEVTAAGVSVSKNTVKTSVLVNNSDTVVIGGIFKQSHTDAKNAVPGLAKLPLVGQLFQRNENTDVNTEVMIFISPTIIEYNSLK
ncbi:MAG: type IV pilus secretin PilQ [Nitrospirota bacterium]|nr:type IV pilus secretin PilQ [Nitrospirota bacterium]